MSKMIRHGEGKQSSSKNIKFAFLITVVWATVIFGLWISLKGSADSEGGFLNFIGRMHPLIVHIPIGLLLVIGLIEVLARGEKRATVRGSVPMLLWISFIGSVGATILGYMLMGTEGIEGLAMPLHLWTGLAVVVFSFLALITKLAGKGRAYALTLFLAIASVSAAGHYGGALVHGKDYLTKNAPEPLRKIMEPVMFLGLVESDGDDSEKAGEDGEVTETELAVDQQDAYKIFIAPILEAKYTECHDANKIKGKLRMDTHELLMAGAEGSDYSTVKPGDPENSEMIVRATLPTDDDDFMPPEGNDPLTEEEIKVLSWWIKGGAPEDKTVAELAPEDEILGALAVMDATRKGAAVEMIVWMPEWESLSREEKDIRLVAVQEAATQYNFSLMPISGEDDRLRVNVINATQGFGDEQLALLEPVAEHILWLDVARSQITDEGMKSINKMRRLERLHLEETAITDAGAAELAPLKNLSYLNFYGTEVSNAIFEHFKAMPHLQKLFVWQTNVDPEAARAFERSVNLEINTGIDLIAAAEQKATQEAAQAAAKKVEEEAAAKKVADAKVVADKKAAEEAAKKAAAAKAAAEEAARKVAAEKAAAEKKAAEVKAKADAAKTAAEAAKKKAEQPAPAPVPAPAPPAQ